MQEGICCEWHMMVALQKRNIHCN